MKELNIEQLLDVSIALSAEKNGDSLLERILNVAMEITECDGGTLYIRDENSLIFKLMITKSMGIKQGGRYAPITLPAVPITPKHVCANAVLKNELINIPDVYESTLYDFSGPRKYDAMTGYKTTSMLVIPMEDNGGNIIGVLQLINAKDNVKQVAPFPAECETVVKALASQAAIMLTNMNYAVRVEELLDSLVQTLSTAIYTRTPYNVNHTTSMVKHAEKFINWINTHECDLKFTELEKRQFIMSVWLHDVGKLIIPLEIMNKATRLGNALKDISNRFDRIKLLTRIEGLEKGIVVADTLDKINKTFNIIERANASGYLTDELHDEIIEISHFTYVDEFGDVCPWITPDEVENLTIRHGTLTAGERIIMEDHVVMTDKILQGVKFSGEYQKVPKWAREHHEFLNGTGYPNKLTAKDLEPQTRLLTILDIFDGLTASDRPYKSKTPIDKAFNILHEMKNDGKIDGHLLELFHKSRVWEEH